MSKVVLQADHLSKSFRMMPGMKPGDATHPWRYPLRLVSGAAGGGFKKLQAVNDVCINVVEGDIYGFIGPNGAGKTTTIRMMLGLISPTTGSSKIMGLDVRAHFKRAIQHVGAFVEGPAFYPYMTGRNNLQLFARLSGGVDAARIQEVLEMVGLARRGDEPVKGYSQGMRQRLGIGLALLHRPRVLILDEPTNGLDPQGIREVRNLVRRIRDEAHTTVFLSSHLLGEMEMICDRIGIIYRGRIIEEGRMDDLIGSGADVITVQVPPEEDERCRSLLKEKFGIEPELVRRGLLELPKGDMKVFPINQALMKEGFTVQGIMARRRTLEEYFVHLTGDSKDVY